MNTIQAVVLDIGEVLLRLDFKLIFATLELGPDVQVSAAIDKMNKWDLYDAFERGKITPEDFHRTVCASLTRTVGYDDFVLAWNSVIVREVEGIRELLERVTVPLYALSNSNSLHIAHCLAGYDWFSLFREVFSSHSLGLRKPEKQIYLETARRISRPPASLLFIDDRPENVNGARAAGYHAEICTESPRMLTEILSNYKLLRT